MVAVAAVAAFVLTDQPWWLLGVLALAPDVGMVGYVFGPRVGAATYNALHVYVGPLALAGAGFWFGVDTALPVALVWIAHIGADRAMGYGLKRTTGFKHTHLSGEAEPVVEDATVGAAATTR